MTGRRALHAAAVAVMVVTCLAVAAGQVGGAGQADGVASPDGLAYAAMLTEGGELYALNCSVCHGKAAGGLQDALSSFPPQERQCTRCHRPNNRVVQSLSEPVIDNEMFSIGSPPALVSRGGAEPAMAATASPAALFGYIRATMPRYEPGRQTDAEYWLLAAYLLDLNGRDGAAAEALDAAALASAAPTSARP